jgi:hypothetical protein
MSDQNPATPAPKPQPKVEVLTEEEVATSVRELFQQVTNALRGLTDPIGGGNILVNLAMNLQAHGISAMAKYTNLKGDAKTEMLREVYQSYCMGHKEIMKKIEPDTAGELEMAVRNVSRLHLTP